MVLAAKAEPRLMTKDEAETAGRLDRDTSGPARWDTREKASSSKRKPVKKSMIKTVLMGESVSPRAWKSRSSIIESLIFLAFPIGWQTETINVLAYFMAIATRRVALEVLDSTETVAGWKRRTKGDADRSGREERQAQAGAPCHWG
jgi:hypothetical protein